MAFNTGQTNATASSTKLISSNTASLKRNIKVLGSNSVYIGGTSSITTADGFHLASQDELVLHDYDGDVYVITVSGENSIVDYVEEDL